MTYLDAQKGDTTGQMGTIPLFIDHVDDSVVTISLVRGCFTVRSVKAGGSSYHLSLGTVLTRELFERFQREYQPQPECGAV